MRPYHSWYKIVSHVAILLKCRHTVTLCYNFHPILHLRCDGKLFLPSHCRHSRHTLLTQADPSPSSSRRLIVKTRICRRLCRRTRRVGSAPSASGSPFWSRSLPSSRNCWSKALSVIFSSVLP